jgi:Nanos RNA binding domain
LLLQSLRFTEYGFCSRFALRSTAFAVASLYGVRLIRSTAYTEYGLYGVRLIRSTAYTFLVIIDLSVKIKKLKYFIIKNINTKIIKLINFKLSPLNMSRQNSTVKKPFCKVCYDSGKSEREYTSHWVKDENGKIRCPTLLSTECRYCFKKGHTAKFCRAAQKKDVPNKKSDENKDPSQHKPQPKSSHLHTTNKFAAFCDDSEGEDEEQCQGQEQEQALQKRTPQPTKKSWAEWSESDSEDEE